MMAKTVSYSDVYVLGESGRETYLGRGLVNWDWAPTSTVISTDNTNNWRYEATINYQVQRSDRVTCAYCRCKIRADAEACPRCGAPMGE